MQDDKIERDCVEIWLPASPRYTLPLRLLFAGLAVRMDFSVESIEDIKMAVSEACSILLAGTERGQLYCRAHEEDGALFFEMSLKDASGGSADDGISRVILEAMADDCEFLEKNGRCTGLRVRFKR